MFGKKSKMKVDTDSKKIDELLSRSVSGILPSKEGLEKEFKSGRRLKIYIGADATGPDLHLGHSTNFIFLERMRRLGHEIVVLFGDFTAMIGDPTDKGAVRKRLTEEDVNRNIKTWKEQINHVLDLNNKENPVQVVRNSKWLKKLDFGNIIDLASNFTVQQMIERDMFEKRLKDNKPIYLHEFFYPLMVGYDSVVLDVDIELGGNDQTFNMLAGRTLQKNITKRNKFVVSTTLLENPVTGSKLMSKSEGGYVSLQDQPNDMFGKIMALPDEAMVQLFIDCTWVSMEQIDQYKAELKAGANPRDIKMKLAHEIVRMYHDETAAQKAEENFVQTFSKGGVPEDVQEINVAGKGLADLLVPEIVQSKTELRRLLEAGAISNVETGEKITDAQFVCDKDIVLKIGKKRFVKLVV